MFGLILRSIILYTSPDDEKIFFLDIIIMTIVVDYQVSYLEIDYRVLIGIKWFILNEKEGKKNK